MLELGAASEAMHRAVGRWVAEGGFEMLVAIGAGMKVAAEEAGRIEKGKGKMEKGEVVWFENTTAACAGIGKVVRRGDRILLKGSHGMALERLLDTLRGMAQARHGSGGVAAGNGP